MAVYDCFPLGYDSGDVLLIRMLTLAPVVDRFVIVEGDRTFMGQPREFLWPQLRSTPEFAPFADRVSWCAAELPDLTSGWEVERVQRGWMLPALDAAGCRPDDTVIISDADEIPHPTAVANLRDTDSLWRLPGFYHQLKLDLRSQYSLNPEYDWEHRQPLLGARRWFYHAQDDRAAQNKRGDVQVFNAGPPGWHLTCQGTPEDVSAKLRAYSHTEWAHITPDDVRALIESRTTLAHGMPLVQVPLSGMPQCVQDDPARWGHLMVGGA